MLHIIYISTRLNNESVEPNLLDLSSTLNFLITKFTRRNIYPTYLTSINTINNLDQKRLLMDDIRKYYQIGKVTLELWWKLFAESIKFDQRDYCLKPLLLSTGKVNPGHVSDFIDTAKSSVHSWIFNNQWIYNVCTVSLLRPRHVPLSRWLI